MEKYYRYVRALVLGSPVSLMAAWLVWWGAAGCVETAECNESVACPGEQVCFEYTCRDACATQSDCGEGLRCSECIPPEFTGTTGRCFGEELAACVP